MAFTPPNLTAIEGARAVPPELFSDTSSVDEHAPHSPSRISRKPIPPTSPSPDLSASERFVIILKLIVRILTLALSILIGVYTVLLCNETVAGNKKNDAAQSAMISAQADANTLAALRACWTQNVSREFGTESVHGQSLDALLVQFADFIYFTGPAGLRLYTSTYQRDKCLCYSNGTGCSPDRAINNAYVNE